jgi:hypothetical protein
MATTRNTPIDVSEYLPDEATADAVAEGPNEYNRNIDPKLRARLAELKRLDSDPDVLRVAPPSVAVYVKPTEVRVAVADDKAGALPKVKLAPSSPSRELPTMPSLKRIRGEPEVPGVVTAPSTIGSSGDHGVESPKPGQRASVRTAMLAVLAVLVPMIIVILLMGHAMRHPEHDSPAPAITATEPAMTTSALSSATPPAAPTAANNATPTVVTSAAAPPAASVGAPPPRLPKHHPRGAPDEPYDAPPRATAAPTATAGAAPTTAPTATTGPAPTPPPTSPPSETTRPAPTPAPSTSALAPWFTP